MTTAQEVAMCQKVCKKPSAQKKEVTNKRGIKKSICGGRITCDDSSWNTGLFCTRGTRSSYCIHF